MATLHDIERRIASVESTRQITHTMEMVSRTKIRRAQRKVDAATPYAYSMEELLGNLSIMGKTTARLPHDEVRTTLIVCIVSDRGLAGGFNANVLRRAEQIMKEREAQDQNVQIAVCGKKGISYFKFRGVKPIMAFRDLSADPRVEEAEALADYAQESYLSGKVDKVICLFNHVKNAAEQELTEDYVVPINLEHFVPDEYWPSLKKAITETDDDPNYSEGMIEFEPDETTVLDNLLPEYLSGYFFYALIDSASAEQSARHMAMKNATENADDMIDSLKQQHNRIRQGAITTEINEIVSGADCADMGAQES
ncbi:MAG: ATP synthase F1 subunit gamma [Coriobacteriia bacterium]|nr:ATP synthase F1 subunit gamma [Coriobacteriia bacterium]